MTYEPDQSTIINETTDSADLTQANELTLSEHCKEFRLDVFEQRPGGRVVKTNRAAPLTSKNSHIQVLPLRKIKPK